MATFGVKQVFLSIFMVSAVVGCGHDQMSHIQTREDHRVHVTYDRDEFFSANFIHNGGTFASQPLHRIVPGGIDGEGIACLGFVADVQDPDWLLVTEKPTDSLTLQFSGYQHDNPLAIVVERQGQYRCATTHSRRPTREFTVVLPSGFEDGRLTEKPGKGSYRIWVGLETTRFPFPKLIPRYGLKIQAKRAND